VTVDYRGPGIESNIYFGETDTSTLEELFTATSYGYDRCESESACQFPLWSVTLNTTSFGDATDSTWIDETTPGYAELDTLSDFLTVSPGVFPSIVNAITELGFKVLHGEVFDTYFASSTCQSFYSLPDIEYTFLETADSTSSSYIVSVSAENYLYEETIAGKGSFCFLKVQDSPTNSLATLAAPFFKSYTVQFD